MKTQASNELPPCGNGFRLALGREQHLLSMLAVDINNRRFLDFLEMVL